MIKLMGLKKIATLIILALILFGGYSVWKSYSEQKGIDEGERVSVAIKEVDNKKPDGNKPPEDIQTDPTPDDRDNQRVRDLSEIGLALDQYAKFNKNQYPRTNGYEKISDTNSSIAKFLLQEGYFKRIYKDPVSSSYYGYKSDGKSYELTAAFEDKNDVRCGRVGDLCIYVLKKP